MKDRRLQVLPALICAILLLPHCEEPGPESGDDLEDQEDDSSITFMKTFGDNRPDIGKSIRQISDGAYILCGATFPPGKSNWDVLLIKVNDSGELAWSRSFGGSESDQGEYVRQTEDGGYIITGVTHSYGSDEIILIKTNTSGNPAWTKTYRGIAGCCVQQTDDQGYIVVATTEPIVISEMTSATNVLLIKTDAMGDTVWTKSLGESGRKEHGRSVQQTADGGYIVLGIIFSGGPECACYDVWLIKTDASGNEEWSRIFGGDNDDRGYSVQQTSDGGYVIGGYTRSSGAGSEDVWLIKTDASGDAVWTKTFGGSDDDASFSVHETKDGGYIIVGHTESFGAGNSDVWLIKADGSGSEEWNRTFGGKEWDWGRSVQQTSDGGYIITGETNSYGLGSYDVWLIKTNRQGKVIQ
jgi:hypothetical protein